MVKRSLTIIFLVAFTAACFSQTKREWLSYGDIAFKNEDYKSAISYYLKVLDQNTSVDLVYPYTPKPYIKPRKVSKDSLAALQKDTLRKISPVSPMEQYATHQVADAYRLNHDYANAETWFKKSVENNPVDYPYERFWYGDALMKNKKYPAALLEFDRVMTEAEKKDSTYFKLAQIKSAGCYLATDTTYVRKEILIKEMDSVFNAGTSSFAVNYYGDASTIQFTSGRPGNAVADPKKDAEKVKYTADIYTLKKTNDGWSELKKVDGPADTEMNEGAGFLTLDKSNYYFTRWSTTNKNECAIYLSKLFNDKWAAAEKLNDNVNLEGYKTMQPALSPDGSILYFSSNRPGGYGKMDLWYVNIDEEGRPSGKPINMGKMFNTAEDEVTPFFHYYTSTLYFSSNGLAGYGGLDVFKSTFNSDSLWSAPKNMGAPVNSSKDDAYFVMERSQRQGFVTSDRSERTDCADCGGTCYKVFALDKEPNVYDLTGTVYNADNNQVIANALLTFKDIRGDKESFYLITDSLGNYFTALEEGWELYIKAQKNKFFGDAGNISTLGLTESQHFVKDFFLSPIPQGDIVIPGIEYDYDKATLRPASKKILDDLVDFLNLNNNLSVEISSHTDARGSDVYNLKLSQERAKSVVDYLIEKGIKEERLLAQGYGETKLLVPNAATEEEHQKNRRTAFRPIKEGAIQEK
ncbi:MAG TPA: OmpA family protein [Bacteroidia bacterium]|jgi:outer membrane protein OmpA-like peptidoglycan-associated protein/tetratricopeptide (TPR) repeat protein